MNSSFVRALFAFLLVSYLRFCYATTRWQVQNQAPVEAIWAKGEGVVLSFWHERLHMGHYCWPKDIGQKVAVLASHSKSGDMSMRINALFKHESIRGSSAKKSDPKANKGGAQAFIKLIHWLRDNGCVAMTPDGPRGPRRVMTEGTLKLSQKTQLPMIMVGLSVSRYIELKSWDKMRIPLPFAQGAIVWDVLPPVRPDLTPEEFAETCVFLGDKLSAVTDQADSLIDA